MVGTNMAAGILSSFLVGDREGGLNFKRKGFTGTPNGADN